MEIIIWKLESYLHSNVGDWCGFDDSDFEKAKLVPTSDTQLYKQAGNSIVVNVLEAIFKNLLNSN